MAAKTICLTITMIMLAASSLEAQSITQLSTRRGALAGAVVGGIIGGQNDEVAAGILIGGLVGGATGNVYGRRVTYRQQQAVYDAQFQAYRARAHYGGYYPTRSYGYRPVSYQRTYAPAYVQPQRTYYRAAPHSVTYHRPTPTRYYYSN